MNTKRANGASREHLMNMSKLFVTAILAIAVLACSSAQVVPASPPPPPLVPAPPPSPTANTLSDVSFTVNEKGIIPLNYPIVVVQGEQNIEWKGETDAAGNPLVTNLEIVFKNKANSKWHKKIDTELGDPDCPKGTSPCKLDKTKHKDHEKGCSHKDDDKTSENFCIYEYTIKGRKGGTDFEVDPVIIVVPTYP